ncbi:MAG: hypothetical protein EOP61_37380, partial [Sphingomonadales bacterium]
MAADPTEQDGDEEKRALHSINAQLRTTIDQMRRELEESEGRATEREQKARAEASTDVAGLQATVGAMRSQLEQQIADAQAQEQRVRSEAAADLADLKATVSA